MKDMLAVMLAAQADVQRQLTGLDVTQLKGDSLADYMRTMGWACSDELHEAVNETGWKPWATSRHINHEEFMGEMTDAWLFFMNLMLAGGMTADDLIDRTAKKQDNALIRFANGYDGKTSKCPKCKRAYDNEGVKCTPPHSGPDGAGAAYCGYVKAGDMACPICDKELTSPGVMCRPANRYQGTRTYCVTFNTYGEPIELPSSEDHCDACLSPLSETSCNNPGKFSIGWCARYKCGHSPTHGLMHGSHGKDKASA